MKQRLSQWFDRVAPKRQQQWDWRAAANFICGGAGGGLLFLLAFASYSGLELRPAVFIALCLVGFGLTCVWLEIGRPMRALNVFRHMATSWMTREASVAPLLFITGALALLFPQPALFALTGAFGLAFLYSQARILNADKGIPAWRHPHCLKVIIATGLAEGAGLVLLLVPELAARSPGLIGGTLVITLFVRALVWKTYLAGLSAGGAPTEALRVLRQFNGRFLVAGHALPVVLVVAASVFKLGWMALLAAGVAVLGGWMLKYTLVRKAAFTQGFAIVRLPVRGRGAAGPPVKPGWNQAG